MGKKLLIFKGGVVLRSDDSPNEYDINGQPPVEVIKATKKNIKKYMKDHKYPKADK